MHIINFNMIIQIKQREQKENFLKTIERLLFIALDFRLLFILHIIIITTI